MFRNRSTDPDVETRLCPFFSSHYSNNDNFPIKRIPTESIRISKCDVNTTQVEPTLFFYIILDAVDIMKITTSPDPDVGNVYRLCSLIPGFPGGVHRVGD